MVRRRMNRHWQFERPDGLICQQYLLIFPGGELVHNPSQFPPLCSPALFGDDAPLKLEIGSGSGEFLCAQAQNEPLTNFVGLEIAQKPIFHAIERAAALELPNIKFIKANFRWLGPLLRPDSMGMIYLHFPDPNTRRKFRGRRLFSADFLDQVHQILTPCGRLSVMTDHQLYFEEMLDLMEQDKRFAKTHAARYLTGFEPEVKSRFQQLWESHGLPIRRFEVEKRLDG